LYAACGGGGAIHVPAVASSCGQERRMLMAHGPVGAGSQWTALSLLGDAWWIISVNLPSAWRWHYGSSGAWTRKRLLG
jgi:hypothetical protein